MIIKPRLGKKTMYQLIFNNGQVKTINEKQYNELRNYFSRVTI